MASLLTQLRRRMTRIRSIRQGNVTLEEAVEFEETMTVIAHSDGGRRRSPLEPIVSVPELESGETAEDDPSAPGFNYWQRFADRITDPEFSGGVYDYLPTREDSNMIDMSIAPGSGGGPGMLGDSILPGGGGKRGGGESLLPGGSKRGGDSSLLGGSLLGSSPRRSTGDGSLLGGSLLSGGRKKGK